MKLLPLAGVAGAATLSTIAITDALWQGFQNNAPPPWNFQDGHPWMIAGINFGHALPYLLLMVVLIQVGPRLDTGGYVRWVRRLLIVAFALFAAMTIWGLVTGANESALGIFEIVPTILFFALLLLPVMLGVPLLRRRALRLPAILLAGSLLAVIGAFAISASPFAHPAYAEAMALFGVALLPFALDDESAPRAARSARSVRGETLVGAQQ